MVPSNVWILFAVVVGILHLKNAEASTRQCYMCSHNVSSCQDPFKGDGPGVSKTQCAGSCAKIENLDNKQIGRTCMPTLMKSECKDMELKSAKSRSCFCDGNLCNGTITPRTSFLGTAIVGVFLYAWNCLQ